IMIEGWGHAAAISDFNGDGWPDIYVANDFVSNDLLYINNKNGTFSNQLSKYFKHTSWNAMGTDVVDINNDGYADLISLEMLPETNSRKKRMLGGNEYYNYFNSAKYGYDHQYVRNTFQLNSGPTPAGHPVFSDVGFMAGVYQTDWSWCPLVADFDNDGFRDLIISNGLPRDVTDLDYIAYDNKQGAKPGGLLTLEMAGSLPVVDLPNYAFRNNGGYTFTNTSAEWGLTDNSFSNGGAYVDLDNDGDLDFVINNINSPAFLYENTANKKAETKSANSLTINITGKKPNTRGIGARVYLFADNGKMQYYEHQPSRGYLSSVDGRAHFGLGSVKNVDSIRIIWPDKRSQLLTDVAANKLVSFDYKDAGSLFNGYPSSLSGSVLVPATAINGKKYKPSEKDFIDYNIQSTLPHKLSQFGPGIAVGDIDGNGFEDFYIGGSSEMKRVFFLQDATGKFAIDSTRFNPKGNPLSEDMGVLLFDVDNDKDLDLYVVTGSYEIPPNHEAMRDRLYINDGKGRFTLSPHQLPKELTNGSCVKAADFDGDGLLDLFV
ncbi:MAG: RNA-binding protein, partial [Chitinophagaceae bacterium]